MLLKRVQPRQPRKISNRRTKTEKAEKTLEEILAGENADALIASLSATERKLLEDLAEEIRVGGDGKLLEHLWKFDYVRPPPTMEQFLTDEYWAGQVTAMTEDNPGLWPTWRQILTKDWDLGSRIHNAVLTGSLGSGKTNGGVLIMLYRFALISLLRNPQNFVGLSTGSKIIYCFLSVTRAQVGETAWAAALNVMGRSPYFVEELKFNPDARYSGQVIEFPKNLQISAGSKGQHILGRNSLGVMLDEGNFRLEKNPDQRAYKLYHEIRTRIKNRFQKRAGFLPAVSLIASSAADETAFTELVIKEIAEKNDPATEIVYSNSIYKIKDAHTWLQLGVPEKLVKLHANEYHPEVFRVAYGLKNTLPSILAGTFDLKRRPKTLPIEEPPIGSKIEYVPIDYLSEYKRDPIGSLQGLSGISIGGSYRLFTSTVDIEWAISEGEKAGLVNPCTIPTIPLSEEDDREIWDFLNHKLFLTRQNGLIKPIRHSGAPRFAHMDLATRTQAGIGVCHMVGFKEVDGLVEKGTGKVFAEQRLIVEYDFILSITGGTVKPISFEKIQKFFIWLRDICGFQFGLITADTFQSFMQLQMLETRGFKTGSLSCDKTKAPYYSLRAGFEERRILMFRQPALVHELENLIDGPKMIDHPPAEDGGTKDLSDGTAGSFLNCVSSGESGTSQYSDPGISSTGTIESQIETPIIQIDVPPFRRATRRFVSKS
jgi:hypothetical protein